MCIREKKYAEVLSSNEKSETRNLSSAFIARSTQLESFVNLLDEAELNEFQELVMDSVKNVLVGLKKTVNEIFS